MDELCALNGWDLSEDRKYMEEVKGKMSSARRNCLDLRFAPNDGPSNQGPTGGTPYMQVHYNYVISNG